MSRSIYKLPYIHRSFFLRNISKRRPKLNIYLKKLLKIPQNLFFFKRNSSLNKNLVNRKICIHNGKYFIDIYLLKKSKGYKLGEFSLTKKFPPHTGKLKTRKKSVSTIGKEKKHYLKRLRH